MAERVRFRGRKVVGVAVGWLIGIGMTAFLLSGKDPDYGLALFVLMPMLVGLTTTYIVATTGGHRFLPSAAHAGMALALVGATMFLGGAEGGACLGMALLILLVPLLIGCLIGYGISQWKKNNKKTPPYVWLLVVLLPPTAADEVLHRDHATRVSYSTSVDIAASPAVVWSEIEHIGTLPPATDWLSKLGLACPETAEIKGRRVGGERVCTLSTGVMRETITAWQPGRRLAFNALETPPTMKELNPFGDPHPAHLQPKYFRIVSGEFLLEPLANGGTRLTRVTTYEHRLRPAFYWTLWSNLAASYAHQRVLGVVKGRAEVHGQAKLASRPGTRVTRT